MSPKFSFKLAQTGETFAHFWEHTVGSGHATLALRADWQRQMKRCHQDLGFQHVRFHGILSDDMGTLTDEKNELTYSFFNADQICDFLLSIGMKPFMELSFMPSTLASGTKTVFHYGSNVTPPKDYKAFAALIQKLVQHWSDRYGPEEVKKWFFEIWNEPNLKAFWTGTKKDYFHLYEVSSQAIKLVNADFQVGGPATADNEWIEEFVAHCKTQDLPLDFVSTHHYPTDAFGKPGDDTIAQLADSHRSVLREEAKKVYKQAQGKPVYYTEWSTSSNPFDELHDRPYAASFITKTVMEARGLVHGYSYWVFSDIFEENYFSSKPFHGGFGLMTIHGIPKPAYRAYELLHKTGGELLRAEGHHPTVDAWVTRSEKQIQVLITNSALPHHAVKTETVHFHISDHKINVHGSIERIDDSHANSFEAWKKIGSPSTLNPETVQELETASQLKKKLFPIKNGEFEVAIPPQGVVFITWDNEDAL